MKKNILILTLLMIIQSVLFCQSNKKCKYLKNTIDEFSKKEK